MRRFATETQLVLPAETPTPTPTDLSFIKTVFGADGLLAQRFPNYKPRPGQIEMVEAIARVIQSTETPKTLMVDAPTGSGKSWAYVVPAVWWLHQPLDERDTLYDADLNQLPRKVVIATANLALQEQLVSKDLPSLRDVLPWPFTFAVAKGLSNYACKDKLHDLASSVFADTFRGDEERQFKMVVAWEQVTEKGDIAELPEELAPKVRLAVTQTPEECPGKRCEYAGECHALNARKAYKAADVVVTNYHLLAADAQADHRILPPHSLLVGDECFPAGTLVGGRCIESIQVGELVASFDEASGRLVDRRVMRRFVSRPRSMVRVSVGGKTIPCTSGHPFLTNRGWVPAISLRFGDLVRSRRVEPSFAAPIFGIEWVDGVEVLEPSCDGTFGGVCPDGLVYNLEVEGTHTYTVEGLVVHNCHNAPDIFRSCIGDQMSAGAFKKAGASLPKDYPLREELSRRAEDFFESIRRYAKQYLRDDVVLFEPEPDLPIGPLDETCRKVEEIYREVLAGVSLSAKERQLTSARAHRIGQLRSLLKMVQDPTQAQGYVVFVEIDERKVAVVSRLVDPADFIRDNILKRHGLRAAVLTSATLCTTPGDFGHISRETGALDSEDLAVESPFDLEKNVLIVVPKNLPDPKQRDAPERIADLVLQVAQLARGRTLGLFTSYRVLRASADRLRASWSQGEVLVQGTAPRGQLVRRFKEQGGSVLLGTSSLWEGVDVPGEALSCVIIDKLPFPSPKDPIMVKLAERDPKGTFKRDAMPRALRAFRQGAGRLVRSETDRGVIVCLDPRIVERGYGSSFLKTMHGVKVSRDIDDVRRFLDGA
jgi:Rad3-related DNA helicase